MAVTFPNKRMSRYEGRDMLTKPNISKVHPLLGPALSLAPLPHCSCPPNTQIMDRGEIFLHRFCQNEALNHYFELHPEHR